MDSHRWGRPSGANQVSLAGDFGTLTVNTVTGRLHLHQERGGDRSAGRHRDRQRRLHVTVSDGDGPAVPQTYTVNVSGAGPMRRRWGGDVGLDCGSRSGFDHDRQRSVGRRWSGADVDVETLTYGLVGGQPRRRRGSALAGLRHADGGHRHRRVQLRRRTRRRSKRWTAPRPTATLHVTVTDGDGPAVTQTYTVNGPRRGRCADAGAVTSGSIAEVDSGSTTTDSGLSGTLVGPDVDVETLTYGIVGGRPGGAARSAWRGLRHADGEHRHRAPTATRRTRRRSKRWTTTRPTATSSRDV